MIESSEPWDEGERRATAGRYREQRTRELRSEAERAVGGPVEAAASFTRAGSWSVPLAMVPVVGWFLIAARALQSLRLGDVFLLALDAEWIYAIGRGGDVKPGNEPGVRRRFARDGVRVVEVRERGPDSRVTLEVDGEKRLELICSSLRTNPWARDLLARLGWSSPDEPIDPTAGSQRLRSS